jgi:murein DD-endopeptidase MepM/ murein hydrolase activator NlpD
MDFSAPTGFPAKATAPGTVSEAGWNGSYGRMVEIDHGNGFSTRFAHLSHIAVAKGQKVERGDVVGAVGSSGRSTGPHLHYEVRRDGAAMDPLRFIKVGKKLDQLL